MLIASISAVHPRNIITLTHRNEPHRKPMKDNKPSPHRIILIALLGFSLLGTSGCMFLAGAAAGAGAATAIDHEDDDLD
ncbi:hypothetical protein [Coraliomargarita sinensis]|uniref:hypothetical protein n=1 Tax=Coraliomargarita sinensis TaxID=2174842 RepID=UPI001E285FD9|nr:hypothetical protein [Coraliomargarita sinensis]